MSLIEEGSLTERGGESDLLVGFSGRMMESFDSPLMIGYIVSEQEGGHFAELRGNGMMPVHWQGLW